MSAGYTFTAHMTVHMALVAVLSPLVAARVAGTRADPASRWPGLFSAIPASLGELIVVWAWHTPGLHDAARAHPGVMALEQLSFLASGLWLWISVFGGGPNADPVRSGAGIIALVLTFAHMTLLGALLSLSPRVLFGHAGLDSAAGLADQQRGGAIMLVAILLSCLAGVIVLGRRLLRPTLMEQP